MNDAALLEGSSGYTTHLQTELYEPNSEFVEVSAIVQTEV